MHYDTPRAAPRRPWRFRVLACWLCGGMVLGPALAQGTLDRVAAAGKLTIGYLADARPFSYADAAGRPAGYAVAVCSKVAAGGKERA